MTKELQNNVVEHRYVKRADLKEFQGDLKKENTAEIKRFIKRIKVSGFNAPIVVWHDHDNLIIDGHQRLKALNIMANEGQMLPNDEIPVISIKADTIERAKEILADYNSSYSTIDMAVATVFFEGCNLEFTSLETKEKEKEDKEDAAPELRDTEIPSVIEEGDIFQLGEHRIMCGDSTLQKDVAALMNKTKADMVRTDPPYNVAYNGRAEDTKVGIKNDNMDKDTFKLFLYDAFVQMKSASKQGAGLYVRHNHKEQIAFQEALEKAGFDIKQQIFGLGLGDYRPKHEVCFYVAHKGEKTTFYGDRTNSTVIDLWKEKSDQQIMNMIKTARRHEQEGKTTIFSIRRDNVGEYVHPTQKPVELCELSVLNNSKAGDSVLDLFMGSGVCLITCEKHNRIHYGMELDPKYMEVIIKRYREYTNNSKEIKCLNRDLDCNLIQ